MTVFNLLQFIAVWYHCSLLLFLLVLPNNHRVQQISVLAIWQQCLQQHSNVQSREKVCKGKMTRIENDTCTKQIPRRLLAFGKNATLGAQVVHRIFRYFSPQAHSAHIGNEKVCKCCMNTVLYRTLCIADHCSWRERRRNAVHLLFFVFLCFVFSNRRDNFELMSCRVTLVFCS